MFNCEVCGSTNFEKHAGFMYCSVCQTQSQDYYEQEYDYHDHTINLSRVHKSGARLPKEKKNVYDDGLWTTWEAFNYILHGMSEELKKCGVGNSFGEMLFRVWMAYLSKCQAAFISKQERVPKLRFKFRERDARVLYSTDLTINPPKKRKTKSKTQYSRASDSTAQSKRSLLSHRRKVISEDYQDYLSSSMHTNSNLEDETLESLGKSSDLDSTDESTINGKSFKHMFNDKEFKLFENLRNSKVLKFKASRKVVKDVTFPAKNRLLSLIHLALLLTGSKMQLSDLLRFIRESHLSFAKVTHFFPHNVKFPKKDHSYIEVVSDAMMPTHLRQRNITAQLACLLGVSKIQTPDTDALIDRYCLDLNLPEQVAEFGKKILRVYAPRTAVPRYRHPLPSYEAWAMASILFVMKLLLGLNDKTEIFLSRLARAVNSAGGDRSLFVFQDWQKFIECRKTVLASFHYPTQEQLDGSSMRSSDLFLATVAKESRDEHRKDRFIPYPMYYIPENRLKGLKEILEALNKPRNVAAFEFEPSLTPQTSHLGIIMRNLSERTNREGDGDDSDQKPSSRPRLPENILKQSFRKCDLEFAFDPGSQMNVLESKGDLGIDQDLPADVPSQKKKTHSELLLNCSSVYWLLSSPDGASGRLCSFKDEILAKTPENFQWLITECARMVEMNVRDVYSDLYVLEGKVRRKPPW